VDGEFVAPADLNRRLSPAPAAPIRMIKAELRGRWRRGCETVAAPQRNWPNACLPTSAAALGALLIIARRSANLAIVVDLESRGAGVRDPHPGVRVAELRITPLPPDRVGVAQKWASKFRESLKSQEANSFLLAMLPPFDSPLSSAE
jgi:hypothetical protein